VTRASRASGFTLAELAVALVILALLLAGALIPISTQMELRRIADTQRVMDQVKEAVAGFALVNGRLPCPADGTVASATTGAGMELFDTVNNRCSAAVGVVPWVTLSVPETDAWGRRLSYRVSPVFGDAVAGATWQTDVAGAFPAAILGSPAQQSPTCVPSPTPTNSTFAMCSMGDMAVLTRNDSTHAATVLASGLPVVIVSHGKNGWGAYKPDGIRNGVGQSGDANSDGIPDVNTDETANLPVVGQGSGTVSGIAYSQYLFYSRNITPAASGCSDATVGQVFCEFDDIVIWIPSGALISRAVTAGRLP
jgi:prepilin-type N-terminal cleavage/methylation domain-containing protein